ncbi:MAG: fused response regulator/phosphatase [Candidatus Riflebacteria bacterium]|nr:fused response regulator/phosphatase [Candidatus Riflebacteria bacterium]
MKEKILLVDEEEVLLTAFRRAFRDKYDVFTTSSASEGLRLLQMEGPFAVVASDMSIKAANSTPFLCAVREIDKDTIRIALSDNTDISDTILCVNECNIFRFLSKPCHLGLFAKTLESCITQYRLVINERESHKQETLIAGKIQNVLLIESTPKNIPGVDLAAITIPSVVVDGDFIDFFVYSDTCFDIILGDVMGKGIHAALIAAAARNRITRALNKLLLSNSTFAIPPTHQIIEEVNTEITEKLIAVDSFMTMAIARADLKNMILEYGDCGHTPGLLFRRHTGKMITLKGDLPPFGFPMFNHSQSEKIALEKGDIICLHSDGLADARNSRREFFGINRISSIISENCDLSSEALIQQLCQSVKNFTNRENMDDDMTAILMKIDS